MKYYSKSTINVFAFDTLPISFLNLYLYMHTQSPHIFQNTNKINILDNLYYTRRSRFTLSAMQC